jgi:hypothetical protein
MPQGRADRLCFFASTKLGGRVRISKLFNKICEKIDFPQFCTVFVADYAKKTLFYG